MVANEAKEEEEVGGVGHLPGTVIQMPGHHRGRGGVAGQAVSADFTPHFVACLSYFRRLSKEGMGRTLFPHLQVTQRQLIAGRWRRRRRERGEGRETRWKGGQLFSGLVQLFHPSGLEEREEEEEEEAEEKE